MTFEWLPELTLCSSLSLSFTIIQKCLYFFNYFLCQCIK